jgi:predicted nuclease of predicted toxin-antitoxin system
VKFLVDAQLPPALAHWLRASGHEAHHIEDVGLRNAGDHAIWTHAMETASIILTKDEDFAERAARTTATPIIVWLRVGNATNRTLQAWLASRLPDILRLLDDGHRLVEVL